MITNLVASVIVTLVTNSTESFPQALEDTSYAGLKGLKVVDQKDKEKWVEWKVTERKEISILCAGERLYTYIFEKPKTNWTEHWVMSARWVRDGLAITNRVFNVSGPTNFTESQRSLLTATNWALITNLFR